MWYPECGGYWYSPCTKATIHPCHSSWQPLLGSSLFQPRAEHLGLMDLACFGLMRALFRGWILSTGWHGRLRIRQLQFPLRLQGWIRARARICWVFFIRLISSCFTMLCYVQVWGFHSGSEVKESACNAVDPDLIPGSGRSPGKENDNPLQYSCLENSWTEEPGRL